MRAREAPPSRARTPRARAGGELWTTTSAVATSRARLARPVVRLEVEDDRPLAAVERDEVAADAGRDRHHVPVGVAAGGSTLITSAPRSASSDPAERPRDVLRVPRPRARLRAAGSSQTRVRAARSRAAAPRPCRRRSSSRPRRDRAPLPDPRRGVRRGVAEALESEQVDRPPPTRCASRAPASFAIAEVALPGQAAVEQVGGAEREQPRGLRARRAGARSSPRRRVEPARLAQPLLERVEHPGEAAELLRRDPLEVERVHEHVPAAVDLADEVRRPGSRRRRGTSRRGSRRRASGTCAPRSRACRSGDENRDAAVLRLVRIRAHGEVDPVGELRARRPDLVAVDDEASPRSVGPRRQRGEVAARAGLREALAERRARRARSAAAAAPRAPGEPNRSSAQPIVLYESR